MNTTKTNANQPAKTLEQILKETHRFQSRDLAFSFAARPPKTLWVMLGDDGRFWVTTPANCQRLERMGYEWAN